MTIQQINDAFDEKFGLGENLGIVFIDEEGIKRSIPLLVVKSFYAEKIKELEEVAVKKYCDKIAKIVKQFSYLATDKWHRNAYNKIGNGLLKKR